MSRLIAGLLAVAVAMPVGAAPVPEHLFPKEQLYFPTEIGAEWVYDDGGYRFTVTKVEEKDGAKIVSIGIYQSNGKTTHFNTVEVSKSGVRELSSSERQITPPTPLLKVPCAKGDEWSCPFGFVGENGKRADYAFTCGGVEEVKVPAGTFRALRVEKVSTGADGKLIQTITTWYAPGVGPVRIQYAANGNRELVKFTPGKGAVPAKK
jgi:hypothetical protein